MTDKTVKYFDNLMSGMPTLSQTPGTLIGVLDACLVNGFGSVTLNSLVVSSNIATGTVSGGHGFAMTGDVGPVINIAGATLSGLNDEWRIFSVPDSTTFTFVTTGISDQTATGTITAKRSPAGWEKVYAGTNKAAYRSLNNASTLMFFHVLEPESNYSILSSYETMSNVDTGTGKNIGNYYFDRAYDGNSKAWRVVADDCGCYIFSADYINANYLYSSCFCGDIVKSMSADQYNHFIVGNYTVDTASVSYLLGLGQNYRNGSIARSHSQFGTAINTTRLSHSIVGETVGNGSCTYPNPAGNDVIVAPIEVWTHTETVLRGWMPGMYSPLHNAANFPDRTFLNSAIGLNTLRTLVITRTTQSSSIALDITGPWR